MVRLTQLIRSSLGYKYITGLSGLGLGLFVIAHLLGNLTLFQKEGTAFNAYAEKLHALGPILIVMEIGIVAIVLLHLWSTIQVTLSKKSARPIGYAVTQSKGGPSKNTAGSRYMIVSGTILLIFLVLHVIQFKFGPGVEEGYVTQLQNEEVRDLHRLVVEVFSDARYVALYTAVMIFLGFHLRHGYWSMFQSLGMMNPRWSGPIYFGAKVLAILLSLGFIAIPIYLYMVFGGLV
jgi:succinate dehydrogenase / fumarate reductase, cytochrome b subunit